MGVASRLDSQSLRVSLNASQLMEWKSLDSMAVVCGTGSSTTKIIGRWSTIIRQSEATTLQKTTVSELEADF